MVTHGSPWHRDAVNRPQLRSSRCDYNDFTLVRMMARYRHDVRAVRHHQQRAAGPFSDNFGRALLQLVTPLSQDECVAECRLDLHGAKFNSLAVSRQRHQGELRIFEIRTPLALIWSPTATASFLPLSLRFR